MEGRRSKIVIFYISFSLSVHLDQHYIFGSGPYSDLVQTSILYRYLPYTLHCTVIRYRYLNTNNYVSRTSRSECKLNWTATFQENVVNEDSYYFDSPRVLLLLQDQLFLQTRTAPGAQLSFL